jgi:TetR/AcrR family transcriptional repressor of nem operon
MKVSRQQAANNRQRVIEVAARLFREKGCNGVSVPEIMRAAHLTHGGFYAQFKSKRDLEREALKVAAAKNLAWFESQVRNNKRKPFEALVNGYLAGWHRDDPGVGCALAAMSPESYRQNPAVRRILTELSRSMLDILASVSARRSGSKRDQGLAALASLVGAVVLSRAVDDRRYSDQILNTVRRSLLNGNRRRR